MDSKHEHDDRPAHRTPWNKGKLIGAKPPSAAKPRLVDKNEAPDG